MGLGERVASIVGVTREVAKLPSYLRGSWAQTRACFEPPATCARTGGHPVMLVPGLFCTPSVFNRLAKALERLGADVFLPPRAYPVSLGPLANTCHLETAARLLAQDLVDLRWKEGVESATIVAHSNGVLISLLALAFPESVTGRLPEIRGVVAMASPFKGAPLASLLGPVVPACADIRPGSPVLERIAQKTSLLRTVLISGFDAIVPEESQRLPGVPSTRMVGFQHMDFIVGTEAKVAHTARMIYRALPVDGAPVA